MANIVVLQHHAATGPSAFADTLDARANAVSWRCLDVTADESLPDPAMIDGLIVMGGPMGVPDRDDHPWMDAELDLLRAAVEAEVPVFGVCLGAQLVATALGGRVERRSRPEFGFIALQRTADGLADPVAAGWPDGAAALLSHEDDIVGVPTDAVPLLQGSDATSAWRFGSALCVQFHPEVTHEQLAEWAELLAELIDGAGVDVDAFLEEARRRDRYTRSIGGALLSRWIDTEVLPGAH